MAFRKRRWFPSNEEIVGTVVLEVGHDESHSN